VEGIFYAFAESIEYVRGEVLALFDALHESELDRLQRQERKIDAESMDSIESVLIELSSSNERLTKAMYGRRLTKGRWYRFHLYEKGLTKARIFSAPMNHEGLSTAADYPQWLDRRTPEVRWLEHNLSLDAFPDATPEQILKSLNVGDMASIVCYNVGQGMCAAGCSSLGNPVIYYDFGGGFGSNSHTYPSGLKFCFNQQPVVLSHWDMDHWISAVKYPAITQGVWLVPRQGPLGVKATQLAYKISQNGTLLIWPRNLNALHMSFGNVLKLRPHSNRNHSGLVGIVQVSTNGHIDTVLLPGDAPYKKIPLTGRNFTGLVATHHGGWHKGDKIPVPSNHTRVAFSYGMGNTYGHPVAIALGRYAQAGWLSRFDTPKGTYV
jgi:hypothetical protein